MTMASPELTQKEIKSIENMIPREAIEFLNKKSKEQGLPTLEDMMGNMLSPEELQMKNTMTTNAWNNYIDEKDKKMLTTQEHFNKSYEVCSKKANKDSKIFEKCMNNR